MHLLTNKAREKIYAHGIRCPYSQDNVVMFGLIGGTQCVAGFTKTKL